MPLYPTTSLIEIVRKHINCDLPIPKSQSDSIQEMCSKYDLTFIPQQRDSIVPRLLLII